MKSVLSYLLKQFILWILIFELLRLIFIVVHSGKVVSAGLHNILLSFIYSMPLDISTACYFSLLPLIILTFQIVFSPVITRFIHKGYAIFIIVFIAITASSEIVLYEEWNLKLHYKILIHLQNPGEVLNSARYGHIFAFFFILISVSAASIWLYNRFVFNPVSSSSGNIFKRIFYSLIFFLCTSALLVTGMRGGLKPIPINQSIAYYSKTAALNDAAVNPVWNIMQSIIENRYNLNKNPYTYYDLWEAQQTIKKISETPKDTTLKILTTNRPNIVMLILESWSADLNESLGGIQGVTPVFDSLSGDGVLFTNMYSSGWTSDQGMAAILSSFHAQPVATITNHPSKFIKLPCLNKKFKDLGYSTSFYFGGQLIYGNIKSFIYFNEFDRIIEGKDFDSKTPQGKLGVPDEYLFSRNLNELNTEKQPFFSVLFTLSTHSPYDMPVDSIIRFHDVENMYLNSAHYTDHCLGEYFKKAKQQSWYKNTLFIVVADHSHQSHINRSFCIPDRNKIPFLLYGQVIKEEFKGMKIQKICSQIDIVSTLLSQLSINHEEFHWSKNILNPYSPEFAYYTWYNGFGWVRPYGYIAYDKRFDTYNHKVVYRDTLVSEAENQLIKEGRSYIQSTFQEYFDL